MEFVFAVEEDEELGITVQITRKDFWDKYKSPSYEGFSQEEVKVLEPVFNACDINPFELMENVYEYSGDHNAQGLVELLNLQDCMIFDPAFVEAVREVEES